MSMECVYACMWIRRDRNTKLKWKKQKSFDEIMEFRFFLISDKEFACIVIAIYQGWSLSLKKKSFRKQIEKIFFFSLFRPWEDSTYIWRQRNHFSEPLQIYIVYIQVVCILQLRNLQCTQASRIIALTTIYFREMALKSKLCYVSSWLLNLNSN